MDDLNEEDLELEQRYKAAFHYTVGKICEENESSGISFSREVIAVISELTWRQMAIYSKDLEAFTKHAKRTITNVDDVKLLMRRNSGMLNVLESKFPKTLPNAEDETGKERKKLGPKRKSDSFKLEDITKS